MPLTYTNPSISIPHSGSFFLRGQMAASLQVFEHFQQTHLIYFLKEHTGIV